MENIDKYNKAFMETFEVTKDQLKDLKYMSIKEWDSIGHMILISAIEAAFSIMLETDDIIDFSSYEKGKEILAKNKIVL